MSAVRLSHLVLPALLVLLVSSGVQADVGGDVVQALKHGLKSDDAAERAKAITDVGRLSGHLSEKQKKQAAALLNRAFDKQTDTEVRRLMVRAMARLHHESGWIPVINAALGDLDPEIKKTARLEVFGGHGRLLEVMADLIRQEKSESYKARLILLLGDRRRMDAVSFLLDQLGSRRATVVSAAAEALEAITGQACGFDADRWRAWHDKWLKETLETADGGPSVSPEHRPGVEPEPHVSMSLHPDFYGIQITSKDVVFAVDISGSVGSGGIDRAKQKLVRAIELLGSDVRIAALFFAEEVHYWKKGQLVPATPENKEDLAFFLRGLKPGRKTDVFTAFNAALKIVDKRVAEKIAANEPMTEPATVIAVSDGQDNMGSTPPHIVQGKLERLDLEKMVVHSIVLGGKHSDLMRKLAHYGGGHYVLVPR